jgi:hypothetical protein
MVTEFELKVLRHLVKYGHLPLGNKMVAWAAAARRLEKKGLAGKERFWFATRAGETYVASIGQNSGERE